MTNPLLDQERTDLLRSKNRLGTVEVAAWPRQDRGLDLVELDVDWVRLSTLNHRTRAEQRREIEQSQRPDLFTSDPMGPEAQDAQYKILCNQDGFKDLKEDLRQRKQQEPSIVTADGVLINGNRRTAAIRSLFHDDGLLDFRYVKCLVLPDDATTEELLYLEAELQVAKDFKQEYSWINEALLIEELYERENREFGRVASRMHRKVDDVRLMYEKLQHVHQLVALAGGAWLHVDFVENESAFEELAKHVRNKEAREAAEISATYYLGTITGVNYRRLRHLRRPDAAARVTSEIDQDPSLQPLMQDLSMDGATSAEPDLLDDVTGSDATGSAPLWSFLSQMAAYRPEDSISLTNGAQITAKDVFDSVRGAINAAANEAEEEDKDVTTISAPADRVRKATAELQRAETALSKARSYPEWDEDAFEETLQEVDTAVRRLRASK